MSRQAKPSPPPVLPEYWPYSYVTRPVSWAIAVWLTAVIVHALDLRVLWCALATVAVAVLAALAAAAQSGPLRTRWFAGMLGLAIGAYLTWCTATTPLSRTAGLVLLPGTAVFGVWWQWIVSQHDPAVDAMLLAEDQLERDAEAGDFPKVLANAGFRGIKAASEVQRITDGSGLVATTQDLRLPATGSISYELLHGASNKIAIATRAKYPIRFMPGETLADVTVLQLHRDVLSETQPYPVERTPKSIHQPISLGVDELGAVQVVTFRELCGLFVGERGSGKSNLINTHLAHLTGCVDALVWMIDGKGGRTAMPWILAFLDEIGKPAIDWVATEDAEMDAMLLAAREAVRIRAAKGGRLGREKVHPSPQQPAIILLVEEASLVTGTGDQANAKRSELTKKTVVLGRSEAVDVILVGQRGTVTMIGSGDMKSQLQYIVGLGISKMDDAQRTFGDVVMSREALKYAGRKEYEGVMLVKAPGLRSVTPIKGWRLDPETIPGVARTNADFRPDLDPETADHVHQVLLAVGVPGGYYGRWDRFKAALERALSGAVETADAGVSGGAGGTAGTAGAGTGGTAGAGQGGTAAGDRGREIVKRAAEAARAARETDQAARDAETFAALTANWNDDAEPPVDIPPAERDDPDVIPPILRFVFRVFAARGETDRIPTQVILDELAGLTDPPLNSKRLGVLMNHCGVTSVENVPGPEGRKVRGYVYADVNRAYAAARDGQPMPPEAFRWTP